MKFINIFASASAPYLPSHTTHITTAYGAIDAWVPIPSSEGLPRYPGMDLRSEASLFRAAHTGCYPHSRSPDCLRQGRPEDALEVQVGWRRNRLCRPWQFVALRQRRQRPPLARLALFRCPNTKRGTIFKGSREVFLAIQAPASPCSKLE